MIEILSFYKFKKLNKIKSLRKKIFDKIFENNVKGLVIVSPEGINGTIAGKKKNIIILSKYIKRIILIRSFDVQNRLNSNFVPFLKLKVKLKNEVVPINETYKFNQKNKKNYLSPRKWDQFLKVKGAKIIDARKPFEYEIGTFKGSINPNTKNFRDFKNYLMGLKKNEPIGMFCTGGIRCEKASNYLDNKGFKNVYMLKGGIINYFNKTNPVKSNWLGECFVFDNRVTIKKSTKLGNYTICNGCRMPLHNKEKKSPKFKIGLSCPKCYENLTKDQFKRFTMRHQQIVKSKNNYKFKKKYY
jgi:Predicted sulfurtransferase